MRRDGVVEFDWTPAAVEKLRAAWAAGDSVTKIGVNIGCTRNAVAGKSHRLKLPPRPSPIKRR